MIQEVLSLAIVAACVGWLGLRFFREHLAGPLSRALLRKGRVAWAMRLRGRQAASGCGTCSSGGGCATGPAGLPLAMGSG